MEERIAEISSLIESAGDTRPRSDFVAPDGSRPVRTSVWRRIQPEDLEDASALIKATFGGNGYVQLVYDGDVPPEEKAALAEAAGSVAVRQVTELLVDVQESAAIGDPAP